jgi:uncharacterized protein (DUF58 family)
MRLTRRGAAVLVLSVLLLAAGQWLGYPLLRALGAILLGAVLAAILVTLPGLRVTVRREVYPDRVERGRPALARLQVSNPTGRRQAGFLAVDGAGNASHTVAVRALLPGAEASYHYELPTRQRGRLIVGPLTLHRVDAFGLAVNRLSTGETASLLVHPRQLPARALVGGHPRHHHERDVTDEALRGSVDLQDVREYVPGDEVRHLHWKATARTGRLMVRDLADPEQPRFTLLLDTRPDSLPAAGFEEAVDLAASLLSASALAGHHTRFVTSAGADFPTAGGAAAARYLLDELCELDQGRGDQGRAAVLVPTSLGADRRGGGSLVVVTVAGAELGELAQLRHRYSALFVIALTGTGGPPAAAGGLRVLTASGAEQAVRQWNEVVG